MPAECSTFWSKGIIDIEFLHVSLKLRLPKLEFSRLAGPASSPALPKGCGFCWENGRPRQKGVPGCRNIAPGGVSRVQRTGGRASVSVGLAPEDQSKRRSRGRRKNFLNQICKSLEKRKGLLGCKGDPVTLTQDVWKGKDHRSPCICCVSCSYLQELKTLP
ncbi:armadillo repeat-containing X-linked protein 1 isoform X3 [Mesocricetus auratus]|uniref:Armadillo repeat-containing X-linked protein 1 isoform X3 n=1 Tax=Mesocricetus auratus TaxID=10036 RepID=A0A1U8BTN4_MESAU|nr:armadillo repeat-containing X-linked protein 1 isoform X3 [Mesocricetus auratus]